ncbi:MAG: hypothetical protein EVB11_00155 [Winogradskyella sp.]|nr:MAG: hypothetical protein EVB11_00155 [Winogradskyella sp.]
MRIAIIGAANFYDSLEFHLNDELIRQGNDCQIFDFKNITSSKIDAGLALISQKFIEHKNETLLNKILDFKPDLVIGVYRHIHPLVVKTIKENKIKIIHINPDALSTFQSQQIFAETYDAYFTKDPYIVDFMTNKLKLNTHLYQEAFNPRFHKRVSEDFKNIEDEINIDVLTFGNLYPYRNLMINYLKSSGCNVSLYGKKAKFFLPELESNFNNKAIYGEEKSRVISGAKIVFNNLHYAEIESVNNKFFEINGIGAFQICDYKKILHELLPIDPKKVSFNSMDEAIKLVRFYMNEPEERYVIRDKIYNHFMENYTYENMVKGIFNLI